MLSNKNAIKNKSTMTLRHRPCIRPRVDMEIQVGGAGEGQFFGLKI